jgi:hypothetical protein
VARVDVDDTLEGAPSDHEERSSAQTVGDVDVGRGHQRHQQPRASVRVPLSEACPGIDLCINNRSVHQQESHGTPNSGRTDWGEFIRQSDGSRWVIGSATEFTDATKKIDSVGERSSVEPKVESWRSSRNPIDELTRGAKLLVGRRWCAGPILIARW